jgi:hypothetical protein
MTRLHRLFEVTITADPVVTTPSSNHSGADDLVVK